MRAPCTYLLLYLLQIINNSIQDTIMAEEEDANEAAARRLQEQIWLQEAEDNELRDLELPNNNNPANNNNNNAGGEAAGGGGNERREGGRDAMQDFVQQLLNQNAAAMNNNNEEDEEGDNNDPPEEEEEENNEEEEENDDSDGDEAEAIDGGIGKYFLLFVLRVCCVDTPC